MCSMKSKMLANALMKVGAIKSDESSGRSKKYSNSYFTFGDGSIINEYNNINYKDLTNDYEITKFTATKRKSEEVMILYPDAVSEMRSRLKEMEEAQENTSHRHMVANNAAGIFAGIAVSALMGGVAAYYSKASDVYIALHALIFALSVFVVWFSSHQFIADESYAKSRLPHVRRLKAILDTADMRERDGSKDDVLHLRRA